MMFCLDLVAVQPYVTLDDYLSFEAFFRKMDGLCQRAAACRPGDDKPAVLVFPEELATFLVLQGQEDVLAGAQTQAQVFGRVGQRHLLPLLGRMVRYRTFSLPKGFFLLQAPSVWRTWYTTFKILAARYHAFIVAGSALLPDNALGWNTPDFRVRGRRVYNTSVTFDPSGQVVNVTRKVNLVPTQEDVLGLSPGPLEEWTPFAVGGVSLANCICYDAFRVPHTRKEPGFRSLLAEADERGVQVVVQPSANPWWWDEPWVFATGDVVPLRSRQWEAEGAASGLPGCRSVEVVVTSHLLARFLDRHFDGASTIYRRDGREVKTVAWAVSSVAVPADETVVHYRYRGGG